MPRGAIATLVMVTVLLAGCGGGDSSTAGHPSAHGKAAAALEHLLSEGRESRGPGGATGAGGVRVTPKQAEEILRAEGAHKGGRNAVEEALAELLHPAGADGGPPAGTAR